MFLIWKIKINYAIAENKERVFELKKDKLQDTLKLLLYTVEKQNLLQTSNRTNGSALEFVFFYSIAYK
jgi:hypothetical protein